MSQGALTIADGSGLAVLAAINAANARFATMASGTARPSDIAAGEMWRETDNPGSGVHSVWLYDGASDVLMGLLNTTAHTWIPSGTSNVYIQTFTGSGTYTPHAGMVNCIIQCLGAGGGGGGTAGGGGTTSANAGGGGAGSMSTLLATAATIGASKTVTIGAAGTAGAAGNNNGGAGGDTSVGSLCIGKGGSGGSGVVTPNSNVLGGLGGVAGTGTITPTGQPGGIGQGGSANLGTAGYGGSSPYGGGGRPVIANPGTGEAGTGKGSGGSGGFSYNGAGTAAGGAGTAGYVFIIEFCNQ